MAVSFVENFNLKITTDMVLRGQGADPAVIRARHPKLVEVAEVVLQKGLPLLSPLAIIRRMTILSVRHQRIELEQGETLIGELPAQKLSAAEEVLIVLCTIGANLECHASELYHQDPSLGMALDALGSVAVEAVAAEICHRFSAEAQEHGFQATLPISPGMLGWELGTGQRQIFDLLRPDPRLICLNSSGQMIPRKSTSLVIGFGANVDHAGSVCDYCSVRLTCRHKPLLIMS